MPRRESPHSHGRSEIWSRPEVVDAVERLRTRLARNLRRHRVRAGLTQEGLAERSGVHAKHIQRIENCRANPQIATLVALAFALDVKLRELLR